MIDVLLRAVHWPGDPREKKTSLLKQRSRIVLCREIEENNVERRDNI